MFKIELSYLIGPFSMSSNYTSRQSVNEPAPDSEVKASLLERTRNKSASCSPLYCQDPSKESGTGVGGMQGGKMSPSEVQPGSPISEAATWPDSTQTARTSLDDNADQGWMDQVDASDELKRTRAAASSRRNSECKSTYLQIPAMLHDR